MNSMMQPDADGGQLSRGEVVWDGKEPRGAPGRGRFLPCDLPEPAKPQGRFVSGFDPASGAFAPPSAGD